MKTYRFATFGCKVNQYETQELRERLQRGGWQPAPSDQPADLCVVNTCTVTARADQKCRQAIRRLARDNPGARLLVVGCYARRDRPALKRIVPGAVVVADREGLAAVLADLGADMGPRGISRFEEHHRAFVKVQEGCPLSCAYCIVPQVRPGSWSRPIDEVLAEVGRLSQAGYREMVLCGTHLGHYGRDVASGSRGRTPLAHLVERLSQCPQPFRVRLSSLEAAEVTDDLLEVMAGNPRVCPHLHLPLQSGSARVLQRMRRPGGPEAFLARVERIRTRLDRPALTTDIIVGFPGETDADFEATCRVARQAGFSRIHVFTFSPRAGTAAAALPDRVPPPVVQERKSVLAHLAKTLTRQYYQGLLGQKLEVLVERMGPAGSGRLEGTACRYAPVVFTGSADLMGRLQAVTIEAADGEVLQAAVVEG